MNTEVIAFVNNKYSHGNFHIGEDGKVLQKDPVYTDKFKDPIFIGLIINELFIKDSMLYPICFIKNQGFVTKINLN